MSDELLFGKHFSRAKDWKAWRSFLAALFGFPLTPDQLAIFQQCTQRNTPPPNGTSEAWLVVGRRGGKSFILATIAVFLAAFHDWKPYLGPGERAIATHIGFCDLSGGSVDEMTLAVAHNDPVRGSVVIDCLKWFKPPFSPEVVVQEFSKTLKSYNIATVIGDRDGGEWAQRTVRQVRHQV